MEPEYCPTCGSDNTFRCYSTIKDKVFDKTSKTFIRKWRKREITMCKNCLKKFD